MYNTYLITYDPFMTDPSAVRFIEFIRTHALSYQLYAPFLGTAYLKSQSSLLDIVDSYKAFLTPNLWTICEIKVPAHQTGGALPTAFWTWLNSPAPPPIEFKR